MTKGSKLRNALDRYQGKNQALEKQKKDVKKAEKRKRKAVAVQEVGIGGVPADIGEADVVTEEAGDTSSEDGGVQLTGASSLVTGDVDWETEDEEGDEEEYDLNRLNDSASSSDSDDDDDEAEEPEDNDENDIPLSDIASISSDDREDLVPHQRLTINNTAALTKALKSFAHSSSSLKNSSFSDHPIITSTTPTSIPLEKLDDDLERELAFYQQSLHAVRKARSLFKTEGTPFSRPADYFAEMVKSDEHMGRVKQKLVDAAANKRAAADARRQRDLKKFGKQVQVAKLQERNKAKKDTLEKISLLKRKRQTGDDLKTREDDMFDVALEDAAASEKRKRSDSRKGGGAGKSDINFKRQKKNDKYGFGGKKRFSKSGDAASSADISSFSARRNKSESFGGGKPRAASKGGASKRLGKSRRAKRG